MPRKTKDQKDLENEISNETTTPKKSSKNTKTVKSKKATVANEANETKKVKSTKTAKTAKSVVNASSKNSSKTEKVNSSKKSSKKIEEKENSENKLETIAEKSTNSTAKKATKSKAESESKSKTKSNKTTKSTKTANSSNKKPKKSDVKKKFDIVEYYDLPYHYNQTVVKVLAQTPNNLFIYWEISDEDRENYKKQFGENFFEVSKPVLIIHNNTLGYSFEVEINDFANSWYLHVNDSKSDYKIELGRRPWIRNEKINTDYVFISTSNEIESPNDRILFNSKQKNIYFKNVKTNEQKEMPITHILSFLNDGKFYNIYEIYKKIYNKENVEEIFNASNPSSGNPSSGSFSSQFK